MNQRAQQTGTPIHIEGLPDHETQQGQDFISAKDHSREWVSKAGNHRSRSLSHRFDFLKVLPTYEKADRGTFF